MNCGNRRTVWWIDRQTEREREISMQEYHKTYQNSNDRWNTTICHLRRRRGGGVGWLHVAKVWSRNGNSPAEEEGWPGADAVCWGERKRAQWLTHFVCWAEEHYVGDAAAAPRWWWMAAGGASARETLQGRMSRAPCKPFRGKSRISGAVVSILPRYGSQLIKTLSRNR